METRLLFVSGSCSRRWLFVVFPVVLVNSISVNVLYLSCITLLLHCVAILYNGVLLNHVFTTKKSSKFCYHLLTQVFAKPVWLFVFCGTFWEMSQCSFLSIQWKSMVTNILQKPFVFRRRMSYRFEMTREWVNNDTNP